MKLVVGQKMADGGVWFDAGDGIKLKIRRNKSAEFINKHEEVKEEAFERCADDLKPDGSLKAGDAATALYTAMTALVEDWKGVKDVNGKPAPCTEENVFNQFVMNDEFVAFVTEKASSVENFYVEGINNKVKKSVKRRSG